MNNSIGLDLLFNIVSGYQCSLKFCAYKFTFMYKNYVQVILPLGIL